VYLSQPVADVVAGSTFEQQVADLARFTYDCAVTLREAGLLGKTPPFTALAEP
jgi:hypothetical protein